MAHNDSLPVGDRDEAPEAPAPVKVYPCNPVIREKLRVLRAESRAYSNAELGKKLGNYSSAIVSQYLNDRGNIYPASVAKIEKAAEDFLQALERRRASGVTTCPSEIADQMFAGFEYIRKTNDLGAIIAESGEGKTRGIELILKKHELAILIEVTEWSRSVHDIMRALWKACAIDGWDRQTQQFPFLVQKMRGSDLPILFDDAHKASRDALSLIATFQEKTNCPVALIGLPDLVAKLESDPQLLSRTGIRYAIQRGKKTDTDLLLHMVRSIAKDINGELDNLCDLCAQVEARHGHKRAVHKQLKVAAELRHADDDLTWCDAFRAAHKYLLRPYQLT